MFCTNCGAEVKPDDVFCSECGETMKKGDTAEPTAPPPVPPASPPPQPPGSPVQAAVPPPPPAAPAPPGPGAEPAGVKKRKKWLIPVLIAAAAAIVIAVVLVLVLVVFKAPGPEATVSDLYKAIEKNSPSAIVALVDPSQLKGGLKQEFESYVKANMGQKIKFEGLEFETKTTGDSATVRVVKGKATFKDESGKTVTEDASKAKGETNAVFLVKKDGKWYVDMKTFPEFYATIYLREADAALEELSSDIETQLTSLEAAITGAVTGITTIQELNARYAEQTAPVSEELRNLRKQADETKAKYETVNSLEDVEQYKEYAGLRIQSVDLASQMLDTLDAALDELGGYISGLAANPPTTQAAANAALQGLQNIIDGYTSKIDSLNAQMDELQSQADQLKELLGL